MLNSLDFCILPHPPVYLDFKPFNKEEIDAYIILLLENSLAPKP